MTANKEWIDRGSYWEHTASQGTDEWLEARVGRVTGSVAGTLAGNSNFKTAEEVGKIISGSIVEEFSERSKLCMAHGNTTEPVAREWYISANNCQIVERGICIPKKDLLIGASVDGDIIGTDGIIEIKCPQKMYRPIQQYMQHVSTGWNPPVNWFNHVYSTHMDQMQHSMACLGKKWCDYIVYSTSDGKIFTQRIPFNEKYWANELYPQIKKNYKLYVEPYMNAQVLMPN